jgi:hypothetical protein
LTDAERKERRYEWLNRIKADPKLKGVPHLSARLLHDLAEDCLRFTSFRDEGRLYIGREQQAARLGVSKRQVMRGFTAFSRRGYVRAIKRGKRITGVTIATLDGVDLFAGEVTPRPKNPSGNGSAHEVTTGHLTTLGEVTTGSPRGDHKVTSEVITRSPPILVSESSIYDSVSEASAASLASARSAAAAKWRQSSVDSRKNPAQEPDPQAVQNRESLTCGRQRESAQADNLTEVTDIEQLKENHGLGQDFDDDEPDEIPWGETVAPEPPPKPMPKPVAPVDVRPAPLSDVDRFWAEESKRRAAERARR